MFLIKFKVEGHSSLVAVHINNKLAPRVRMSHTLLNFESTFQLMAYLLAHRQSKVILEVVLDLFTSKFNRKDGLYLWQLVGLCQDERFSPAADLYLAIFLRRTLCKIYQVVYDLR